MKTKEIDVWVDQECLSIKDLETDKVEFTAWNFNISTEFPGQKNIKAKLVFEIPEKKVELTESRFNEIMNNGHNVISVGVMKYLETELGFNKSTDFIADK